MRIISGHKLWFVEVKSVSKHLHCYIAVAVVEPMLFYSSCIICNDSDEAFFATKPSEDTQVARFQFPDSISNVSQWPEAGLIRESLPSAEDFRKGNKLF